MESEPQDQKEHPSTYMVQDRSSQEELERLRVQDQMFTAQMGGVLPEQPDPTRFLRVADIGCGTGGWLIELAKTYPHIQSLLGIDVSARMVDYAQQQASVEGVADHVTFYVMDALRMIEVPEKSLDLVNHRFNFSYLRTWDWPNLLQKYRFAACSGGVIRVTEGELYSDSTSSALNALGDLGTEAFWHAGHFFTHERTGVTSSLADILRQQGLLDVQTRVVPTEYVAGTDTFAAFARDIQLVFRTILPFLKKWIQVPDNYDALCQQAFADLERPDFRATGRLVTVWGSNT